MWYEINVSYKGQHLFATAERSITTLAGLRNIVMLFEEKFPVEQGYTLMISRQEKHGKWITADWVMGRKEKKEG